jgi:prostatic aicd phosphatase
MPPKADFVRNDNVLLPSAVSFWQGFYPPSSTFTFQTLANGTSEDAPLNGYQYVTINGLPSDSPDLIWIAGDQSCPTCINAQQSYYNSTKFLTLQPQLQPFYNQFIPLFDGVLPTSSVGFQNAYNVFDYINVGYIHNATIFNNVSSEDLFQLRTLADQQAFDLYYNTSQPNRSISGQMAAYLVLSRLNETAAQTSPSLKVTYFDSAYTTQMPFWALTNLTAASPDFYGLPDYASTMTFELRRVANSSSFDDLFVRFGFRNGSDPSTPVTYFPMFGGNETDMPWSVWSQNMSSISISSQAAWCTLCGSNQTFCTGVGSTAASGSTGAAGASPSASSSSGLSNAAAGGIGAGVTIGVIAIFEGLAALLYFSSRKKAAAASPIASETGSK